MSSLRSLRGCVYRSAIDWNIDPRPTGEFGIQIGQEYRSTLGTGFPVRMAVAGRVDDGITDLSDPGQGLEAMLTCSP
jgi:hypothetical protein